MTDWDNLEGDELNVALGTYVCDVVEKTTHGDLRMIFGGEDIRPLPDYANSIDAQKRDLEPLLGGMYWNITKGGALSGWGGGSACASKGPEPLARARCLGKALEERHSKALEH